MNKFILSLAVVLFSSLASATVFVDHSSAIKVNVNELVDSGLKVYVVRGEERSRWDFTDPQNPNLQQVPVIINDGSQYDVVLEFYDGFGQPITVNELTIGVYITGNLTNNAWSNRSYEGSPCKLTGVHSMLLSSCEGKKFTDTGEAVIKLDVVAIQKDEMGAVQSMDYSPRYVKIIDKKVDAGYSKDKHSFAPMPDFLDIKLMSDAYFLFDVKNVGDEAVRVFFDEAGIGGTPGAQFAVPSPSKHVYSATVMPTEYSHSVNQGENASVDIYFTFKDTYATESVGENGRFHLSFALDDRAKGSSAPYLRREINYTVSFDVTDVSEKCLDIGFKQLGAPTNLSIIGDDGDYFDVLHTTVSKSMISNEIERCPVDIDFDLEFVPEAEFRSSIVDKLKNRTYAIAYPGKNPKGGIELAEVDLVTSLRKPRNVTDTYGWMQTNASRVALPCAEMAVGQGVGALDSNVSVLYDPLLETLEDNITGRGTPECSLGVLTGAGRSAMTFMTVFFNAPDDTILIPDEFNVRMRLTPYVYTEPGVKVKVSNPSAVVEKDVTVRVEKQCLQALNTSYLTGEVTLNKYGENGFLKIEDLYGSYRNVCPFPVEISKLYMVNGRGLPKSDLKNIESDFDMCDEASPNPFEPLNFDNCTRIFSKLDVYSPEDMLVPFSWTLQPDEVIHIPSRLKEDAYTQSIPPYLPSIAQPYEASLLKQFVGFADCVQKNMEAGAEDITEISEDCPMLKAWPALSSDFFKPVHDFNPYFVIEYRAVDRSKERTQWPWMTFSHRFDRLDTCDRCGLDISRPQVLAMNAWGQPIWLFYIQKSPLTKIHSAACEGAAQDYHGGYCDVDQATFALLRRLEIKKRFVDAYLRGVQRAFSKVNEGWGSDNPQTLVNLLDQVNISNTQGCQYHLLPGGGFNLTSTSILKCAIFDIRNHTKEDNPATARFDEALLAPYVISEIHDTLVDMIEDFNATQGGYDNDGAGGAGIFLARELHECIQVSSRDKFMLVRAFPDGLTAESPTVSLGSVEGGRNHNFFSYGLFALASNPADHYFDLRPTLDYTVRSITLDMAVPAGEEYGITLVIQDLETGEELMNTASDISGFNLNVVVPGDITLGSGKTYRLSFTNITCTTGGCTDTSDGKDRRLFGMTLQVAYARLETGDPILNAFDHLLQCVSETNETGHTMSNYKFSILNDVISSTSMGASVGLGLLPLVDMDPVFARSFERLYGFIKGLAAGQIRESGEICTYGQLCLEPFSCGTSNISIDLIFDDSYDRHMDCTVGGVYQKGNCGGAYNAWYNYSGHSSAADAANYLKAFIEAKPFYSPEEHDDEPPWDSACDVPDPHYKPEGVFDDIDTDFFKDRSNCTDNGNNFSCVFEDYEFPLVKEPDYIPFYMPAAGGLTSSMDSVSDFKTSDVAFASKAVHFYAQGYNENLSNEPNRTIMNFFASMLYPGYVDNSSFAYERAALLRNSPFDDRSQIEAIMAGLEWGLQNVGNGLFYTSNYNRNNVVKAFICANLTISPLRVTTEAVGGNYLYYNAEDCNKLFNSPYKLGAALQASDINVTEWMGFYNSNNTSAVIVTVVKPIVYFDGTAPIVQNYVPQTYIIAKDNTTMSTLLQELAFFWRGELPSNILFLYKNMSSFWLLKGARIICDVEASMKYRYFREASDTMDVSIQKCLDYYHNCMEPAFPDEDLCEIPEGATPCACRVEGDFTEDIAMNLLVEAMVNSVSTPTTPWNVAGMPGNWEQYFSLLQEKQMCDMQGFLYGIFATRIAKYYDFIYKKFGEPAPFIEILPGGVKPGTDPMFARSSKVCNAIESISADRRAPCMPEGYDANCSITLRIRPRAELAKVYGPGGFDLEEMVNEEIIPGQVSEFFGYISNDYSNNYGRPIKLLFNTTFYVTGDIGWLIPLLAD